MRDARFEANWRGAAAAGLRRGAVHVYSLCRLAADQANEFNTIVPRTDDALPPARRLDFAPDCAARPDARRRAGASCAASSSMVETHTGEPVMLLVSRAFDAQYA